MGKRRNTAKTGDRGLYKARNTTAEMPRRNDDDDPMYNEVDRFHNARDEEFLKLDAGGDDSSQNDDEEQEEAVMDVGVGDESSSDESSSESEEEEGAPKDAEAHASDRSDEEDLSSSDDDDDEGQMEMEDVRDWGQKKSAYYHGDTADLEIGQDEEDAYLEEEAAKEVQKARYEEMSEDDFVLSDTEDGKKGSSEVGEELAANRDVSKLSCKDKQKLLSKQHPELLPLLSYFSGVVEDLDSQTTPAVKLLFEGEEGATEEVGCTKMGQQFLLTKALLQSSTALNTAMYLLLKSEQSEQEDVDVSLIQSHPVMARLQKWNAMSQKLDYRVEDKVEGLREQLENLVKVAELMKTGQMDDADDESEDESEASKGEIENDGDKKLPASDQTPSMASSDESDESDKDVADEEEKTRRNVLNEARFGLRLGEIEDGKKKGKRKRRAVASDLGDNDGPEDALASAKTLASTLNAIEQRSAARTQRANVQPDQVDDHEDDDDALRRGIEMMEEEMGKLDDDEGDEGEKDGAIEDELEDGEEDFYAQVKKKSKSKIDFKKSLYRVAPKLPRVEPEAEGERAINKTILNNRGLVPHKSVINRNPRVKKREQYRKALIRRRGSVREVRKDEGHKYGGEETGIKSSLSRSRKLA